MQEGGVQKPECLLGWLPVQAPYIILARPDGSLREETAVPNTKSAKKMVRVAERRRLRNQAARSSVRTYVRKAEQAVTTGEAPEDPVRQAIRALDMAVTKGILHRNNAARRKSRLMKKLNRSKPEGSTA
jgi:small subunit ribosomal protein S20